MPASEACSRWSAETAPSLRRQFGAAEGNDLVGVDFDSQTGFPGSAKQPPRLVEGKDLLLAENVAEFGQLPLGYHRQDSIAEIVDEGVIPPRVFFGNGMGAEKGPHHINRMKRVKLDHRFQLLDFGIEVEPVAAFPFHGGHPEGKHGIEAPEPRADEFLLGSGPGSGNRADDTTAPLHDVHVAVAPQPPGKLLGPIAAKDKMGVRIDEAGQHGAVGSIDDSIAAGVDPGQNIRRSAHGADDTLPHDDGTLGDHLQILHRLPAFGGETAAGDQFGGILDDQVSFHRFPIP